MNIGDIAKATGILGKIIRYSVETSLIRPATRALTGYRIYSDNDLQTLRFVRRARDLASHCHDDDRPDCPILKTLGSTEAVAPLPKTRDRRKTRAFDRVR